MKTPALVLLILALAGCAGGSQAAGTVLDISNSVCEQVTNDPKPDPAWVTFSCSVIGVADGVAHTFMARVKREDAATFAARRCPQEGGVAP